MDAEYALLGSSTVLYHQIAGYTLAAAGRDLYPFPAYLLRRDRRRGVHLALARRSRLFSVFYAWDTYDLPNLVAGMLGGSETGRAARPWRWR